MRIDTGIKINDEGIEKRIIVEQYRAIYPYPHVVTHIMAEPTKTSRNAPAYIEIRHRLGDDWDTDLTDNWFMPGVLTPKQQIKIHRVLENL